MCCHSLLYVYFQYLTLLTLYMHKDMIPITKLNVTALQLVHVSLAIPLPTTDTCS
jgi:hypothetical protein